MAGVKLDWRAVGSRAKTEVVEELLVLVVGALVEGDLMMRAARAKERAERDRPRRMRRRATSRWELA